MLLFSLAKPTLKFIKLNQITDAALFEKSLNLVTDWFTDEWGYIHDKDKTREQAVTDRKKYLIENADKIYLAFYGSLVVGSFRVECKEWADDLVSIQAKKGLENQLKTSEIWFVYVEPTCRSLGLGRQIVRKIKQLSATEMKTNMILLETLKPGLNHLYKTEGAEEICENHLNNNLTDVLRIKL